MCKMFGALLDSPSNFELSFHYEINEKEASYDGFGFGYFSTKNGIKNGFEITKKALTNDSQKGKFSEKYSVNSDNLINHIRYASSKNVDYDNTHPFVQNRLMICFNGSTPKNLDQLVLANVMKDIINYFPSSNKIKEIFAGIGKNLSKVENSYTIKYFVDEFFSLNAIYSPDKINADFLKKFKSLLKETNKILRLNLFIMFDDYLIVYQDINGHNRLRFMDIEKIFPEKLNEKLNEKLSENESSTKKCDKYKIIIKDKDSDISCELNSNTKGYIFLTDNLKNNVKFYKNSDSDPVDLNPTPLNNSELFCLRKGKILVRV